MRAAPPFSERRYPNIGTRAEVPASAVGEIQARGRRVTELDGMRGLLSIFVVVGHLGLLFGSYYWIAMELFFCMSGYFIAGQAIDNRGSPGFWSTYLQRRILRIWPLYYTVLFSIVSLSLIATLLGREAYALTPRVFQSAFFVQLTEGYGTPGIASVQDYPSSFAHSWSVALEEQFYLVAPLIAWFLPMPRRFASPRAVAIRLVAVIAVPMLCSLSLRLAGYSWWLLLARSDALVLGIGIAWAERRYGDRLRRNEAFLSALKLLLPLVLIVVLFFCVADIVGGAESARPDQLRKQLGVSLMALVSAVIVSACVFGTNPRFSSILRRPTLQYLGEISYSTYMWHFPILIAINILAVRYDWNILLRAALTIPLVFVVAGQSHQRIELPFLAVKKKFRRPTASRSHVQRSMSADG